jgi:outer membrane lipoprotein-sorting protein
MNAISPAGLAIWPVALIFTIGILGSYAQALSAHDILEREEQIRTPSGDYKVEARVVSTKPGRKTLSASYEVLIKGKDRTLIKTMAPASDRGTSLLMVGHDIWVFVQDISKPIRISLRERLLGEVSNGDLARANFIGDYTPKLVAENEKVYVLKLTANSEDVTYGSIKLWVDRATFRPIKTQFFALSGKMLKVGHYRRYRELAGGLRPSELLFEDALAKGQASTIFYENMTQEGAYPEKYFTKDYLKKLKY